MTTTREAMEQAARIADEIAIREESVIAKSVAVAIRERAAALALPDEDASGWRPIDENTPRDGTPVDLWCQGQGFSESCRITDCWFFAGKWWRYDEDGDDQCKTGVFNAVFWMLPPAPPATTQEPK